MKSLYHNSRLRVQCWPVRQHPEFLESYELLKEPFEMRIDPCPRAHIDPRRRKQRMEEELEVFPVWIAFAIPRSILALLLT